MVYRQYFCIVNAYRFCKVLKMLANFLFVVFYVNIKKLKIGYSVKVEALQELISMTHFMVAANVVKKSVTEVPIS